VRRPSPAWLELPGPPPGWGCGAHAHLLVGALSASGRWRGLLAECEDFAHLAEALGQVVRKLGGLTRAASLATEAVATARTTGCSGTIVVRADSAFYSAAFTGAVRAAGAFFSVTVQMNPHVKAAIAGIGEDAWTPVNYPRAIWDDQLACWVSDAQVAEVSYTAFTSKKNKALTARLIVRRVKDLNRKAGEGQDELFTLWRYHAVFTDSPFTLIQAEEQHRDHAQVEQVFADLADGPLAHLPSGSFPANAAWLACAAISHNLLRAAGSLASLTCAKAREATLRRDLIDVAARLARHGRGEITLHLPGEWHREQEWMNLFEAATGPPAQAA
jgi:hypothetical protein